MLPWFEIQKRQRKKTVLNKRMAEWLLRNRWFTFHPIGFSFSFILSNKFFPFQILNFVVLDVVVVLRRVHYHTCMHRDIFKIDRFEIIFADSFYLLRLQCLSLFDFLLKYFENFTWTNLFRSQLVHEESILSIFFRRHS